MHNWSVISCVCLLNDNIVFQTEELRVPGWIFAWIIITACCTLCTISGVIWGLAKWFSFLILPVWLNLCTMFSIATLTGVDFLNLCMKLSLTVHMLIQADEHKQCLYILLMKAFYQGCKEFDLEPIYKECTETFINTQYLFIDKNKWNTLTWIMLYVF